jgi:uncharacterized protein (TIGR03118 family)
MTKERLMSRITFKLTALGLALAAPVAAQLYRQVNLVSDISGVATITDPLLTNPWGVSFNPTGPFWVSNQGSSTATVYAVSGASDVSKVALTVNTPGFPSGQVFNGSSGFVVSQGGASGPASFIFAQLNGTISGWNMSVPPPIPPATLSTQAIQAATGAPTPGAYTGIALGTRSSGTFLYAANNSAGRIDVFDSTFAQVTVPGGFVDASLPPGDLPFNIVNIGGSLYVTYSGTTGVVNVFDTDGHFVKRFATGGTLLNPWGVALAPADFGKFSNAVLIGSFNFGNPAAGPGRISAFDQSGAFLGLLEDTTGAPLSIDGLWTLTFGNGQKGGASNVLYFTAGIQGQAHGVFGRLAACGPVISGASASPNTLWPPNKKFVSVTLNYTVTDDCDTAPVGSISISSNEGAPSDAQVVDLHHVNLLAQRSGNGDGRVYTITISYKDSLGLTSSAKVTVTVAHDQGNQDDPGDQGDQGDGGKGKHGDK